MIWDLTSRSFSWWSLNNFQFPILVFGDDKKEIINALRILVFYNIILSIILIYMFFQKCFPIYYSKKRRRGKGRPKRYVDEAVRDGDFVSMLQIASTTSADIVGLREDESADRQPMHTHYFNHSTYTRFYEKGFGKIRSELVSYCPEVFDRLRAVHNISLEEISQSFSPATILAKGEGKSGSDFMVSADKRYCLKTVNSSEKDMLIKMLPSYFEHIMKYPESSLLCRILGLFRKRYNGMCRSREIEGGKYLFLFFPLFILSSSSSHYSLSLSIQVPIRSLS